MEGDVAEEEPVQAAVEAAGEFGPLRVLVNSAGIASAVRTVDRHGRPMPLERFERVVATNLIGTFNCNPSGCGRDGPHRAGGRRRPAGRDRQHGLGGGLRRSDRPERLLGVQGGGGGHDAAHSAGPGAAGGRVNTIAPGLIDTPIYGTGEEGEQFKARLATGVLFPKRLGTADELASMVMELLTNDYMNGETIRVDAGIRLPPK